MDDKKLKIGEMAELNRVSIPTLRLYDQVGILKPSYTDPQTHYRYYSINQTARLDMIQYMKELGMSLAEIKNILETGDIHQIENTLIEKKKQVKAQIRQLEQRLSAISRTIESVERFRTAPSRGTITIEYISHRKIYAMPTRVNFYEYDISMYERILNELKENIRERNLPQIYYCNAGTSITREDFVQGRLISNEIFIFVDDDFPANEAVRRMDGGMYVCIYLDEFEDEPEFAGRLLEYCRSNHYQVCGDYICEVLTEFNVFDSEKRSMFLKLQVPLKFR